MTKKVLKSAFTILAAASLALSVRADITGGLVGYWKLTDGPGSSTAADASGNGNNGTLTGFTDATYGSMWTTVPDPVNGWPYGLLLNQTATANYVSVPDSSSLDSINTTTKKFTLAAWVNLSTTPGSAGAAILCKGNGGGGESWCLDVYSSKFRVFVRKDASTTMNVSSTFNAVVGTWYHVVATYDSSASQKEVLYINGVANANSGTGSTVTTIFGNTHAVSIGNRQTSTTTYNIPFPGTIDEVRIYNRALSAAEVGQLYAYKAFPVLNKGIGSWTGLAGSGGNATLDSTSLNFATNLWTAPLGASDTLADLLAVESANTLPLGIALADFFYSNSVPVFVQSTNLTLAAGGVALGTVNGSGTLTCLNAWSTYTLTSPDSLGLRDGPNPTSLVQSGTGTLVLLGTNTFGGSVTINSGTLQLGNGTAAIGQELGSNPSITDNGSLVLNGTNNLNFAKSISGSGSVTHKGGGVLTLNPANTYSGGTTISNGTVIANSLNDASSPLGTGPVTLNGATLLYTSVTSESTARQVNGTAGTTNTLDVPAGITLEISGRVTSGGVWLVNKTGAGTLTLSGTGDNSYLGMNVNAGTVILNKTGGHAIGNPLTVASGATVQLGSAVYDPNIYNNASTPVTINSGGVFDANGQPGTTFNSLILSGTGIGGAGALVNSAAGTLSVLNVRVTLAADTTIGGAGSLMLSNLVMGPGKLTYNGTGALALTNLNMYSGGTLVASGTLAAGAAYSVPGDITVTGTGLLDAVVSNAVAGNVTLLNSAAMQLDDPNALSSAAILTLPASPANSTLNLNFSGTCTVAALIIGGTAQPAGTYGSTSSTATHQSAVFNSLGLGVLNVTGQAAWDPALTVASPGSGGTGNWDATTANWLTGSADAVWSADAAALFAGTAGTVTLAANANANSLTFATAGYTITNTDGVSVLTLNGNNPTIAVPAGNTTVGCTLAESGLNPLIVNGPGTLTLAGANTFSSGVTVNGATLRADTIADANCAIGPSGNVTLQGGSTLSYSGGGVATTTRTIAAAGAATSTLDVPAGTLTLAGSVKSGLASAGQIYTKTGAGTLVLGGAVDNGGATMAINQGTVVVAKTSSATVHGLGGGVSTVAGGASLQLGGSGGYALYNGCILSIADGGVFDLAGQTTGMSTLTNTGAGLGAGALINSVSGTTSYLTNGGSGMVLAGPTTIGGAGNITLPSVIKGSYGLTYAGTATLTLSAANSYSGGTTVNPGGTVQLNSTSGAGTNFIALNGNGTLVLNGTGTYANSPITGGSASVINVNEPAGNTFINGDYSGFAGTINCLTATTTGQLIINTPGFTINPAATWNIANGATLVLQGSNTYPSKVIVNGIGNSQAYGSLRVDLGCTQSGDVLLAGANVLIGNGFGGVGTISGVISDAGNGYGFTKVGGGSSVASQVIMLTATNTYTGPTTISTGTLEIGGAGQLAGGNYAAPITNNATFLYASSAPQTLSGAIAGTGLLVQSGSGVLTLSGTNSYTGDTLITNASTLTLGGAGCLGVTATATNYAGAITNYGVLDYSSSATQMLSGVISGTGALVQGGSGTLTLSGVNTYTGGTVVTNSATLALASGGSISSTPSITIGDGATLDVSAYASYSMLSGTALTAGGAGGTSGSAPATIKGAASSGATVTVAGPLTLNYEPQTFTGDASHPALVVSQIAQGQLVLGGSTLTVNNAGAAPLGPGTYSLVQVAAGGTISFGTPALTITGKGLAADTTASLSVSGGSVNLVVASAVVPVPGVGSVSLSGGDLVFSGTNGVPGGTYYVLTSTNAALPLPQWTPVATNVFDSKGAFSVTNTVGSSPIQFFSIEIPKSGN